MIAELITKLQGHLPDIIYDQLPQTFPLGVDGPKRLAHLLGQCKHESLDFTHFTENLSYSGSALWSLFHTHFTSPAEANTFAHQPERIANRIYANRMGNRDEASGDGWYRRGEGAIQLTGTDNQQHFFTSIGLPADSDPQLIATTYQLVSGAWFFKANNLWTICDQGIDTNTCTAVTKHVNGGTLGLDQRILYTQQFYKLLTT